MQKTKRKILSTFYRLFNLRPSSEPYISGDTFRSMANYIHIPSSKNIKKVSKLKDNDIVFVSTNDLNDFINCRSINPDIKLKIICHNSDYTFDNKLYLSVNIFSDYFFVQNCNISRFNVIPLPIGLENRNYHNNGVLSRFKKLDKNIPHLPFIFYSFDVNTNIAIRGASHQYLVNSSLSIGYQRMNNTEYLNEMSKYMFCFSPPGNGIDCHRTWESIAINVVPICLKSPLIDFFVDIGLPIWSIERVEELDNYQETSKLKEKYFEIKRKSIKNSSTFYFWKNLILSYDITNKSID